MQGGIEALYVLARAVEAVLSRQVDVPLVAPLEQAEGLHQVPVHDVRSVAVLSVQLEVFGQRPDLLDPTQPLVGLRLHVSTGRTLEQDARDVLGSPLKLLQGPVEKDLRAVPDDALIKIQFLRLVV